MWNRSKPGKTRQQNAVIQRVGGGGVLKHRGSHSRGKSGKGTCVRRAG